MMRSSWLRRAVLAAAALFAISAARAGDIYTARNVAVDATAESATKARDVAIAKGHQAAWAILFKKLTQQADWARMPQLDEATLNNMIVSFSVADERTSSTRYLADISYKFDPAAVQQAMMASAVQYINAQAKPYLVLPVYDAGAGPVLFGDENPWAQAWAGVNLNDELVPLVVPSGDLEDITAASAADALNADWMKLSVLADRYGVERVIVAQAKPGGAGLTVKLIVVGSSGRSDDSLTVGGTAEAPPYEKAIAQIAARLADAWKAKMLVAGGATATITAAATFNSLPEWAELRRRITSTPLVKNVGTMGVSTSGATVIITHEGSDDQLISSMAESGLTLSNMAGQWTISGVNLVAPAGPDGVDPSVPAEVAPGQRTAPIVVGPTPEPAPGAD